MADLSLEEFAYYDRQILLNNFGMEQQQKLKNAKVLVVGAGGLGCPILSYLTGAGVGLIGILDADKVEMGNLHRQVLYGSSQIGHYKSTAAVNRLKDLNPHINLLDHPIRLVPENAEDLISEYDLIIDATDNFQTRYLINDVCVIQDKPFVMGSIDRFQGQVSVFNHNTEYFEKGPSYRCLFPDPPEPETAPDCSQQGVIGVLPGVVGTLQASEAIKVICGIGNVLSGKLLITDVMQASFYTIEFKRNENTIQQAMCLKDNLKTYDYANFCNVSQLGQVNQISATELAKIVQENEIQIIDVRENKNGETIPNSLIIPYSRLSAKLNLLQKEKAIVLYCERGIISSNAATMLTKAGFGNVFNLIGGFQAWKKSVLVKENYV